MKTCKCCLGEFEESAFYKRADGSLRPNCKKCISRQTNERLLRQRAADPEGFSARLKSYRKPTTAEAKARYAKAKREKRALMSKEERYEVHLKRYAKEGQREKNREYYKKWKARPEVQAAQREYSRRRQVEKPEIFKRQRLVSRNVSLEEYNALLKEQGNVCAICGGVNDHKSELTGRHMDLAVDHCHSSNITRGLLCTRCNTGLGLFRDRPELLLKAVEYLGLGFKLYKDLHRFSRPEDKADLEAIMERANKRAEEEQAAKLQ